MRAPFALQRHVAKLNVLPGLQWRICLQPHEHVGAFQVRSVRWGNVYNLNIGIYVHCMRILPIGTRFPGVRCCTRTGTVACPSSVDGHSRPRSTCTCSRTPCAPALTPECPVVLNYLLVSEKNIYIYVAFFSILKRKIDNQHLKESRLILSGHAPVSWPHATAGRTTLHAGGQRRYERVAGYRLVIGVQIDDGVARHAFGQGGHVWHLETGLFYSAQLRRVN